MNPSLALVRALADRGDDVAYYSTGGFADAITAAGARYRPYRTPFLRDVTQLPQHLEDLAAVLMRTTADVLETERSDARSERPDYVITDSVAPWRRARRRCDSRLCAPDPGLFPGGDVAAPRPRLHA